MSIDGSDVLLMVDVGTDTESDFVAVAAQQDLTISESRDIREVTSKLDDHKKKEYGEMDTTASLESLFVVDDSGEELLRSAVRDATKVTIRIQESDVEIEEGTVLVSSLERNFPRNDNSTFSAELEFDGPLTTVN